MNNQTYTTPRTADKPNGDTNGATKVQHEPLRHSEMYVSLLVSLARCLAPT
jgi:hypothetical protein